ncbi:MAG: hypothetical protein V5B38_23580 [Candidatus Accumulibacter propinquus]
MAARRRTHNDIEVSCLPQDLPAFIEVDLKESRSMALDPCFRARLSRKVTPVLHGDDYVVWSSIRRLPRTRRRRRRRRRRGRPRAKPAIQLPGRRPALPNLRSCLP